MKAGARMWRFAPVVARYATHAPGGMVEHLFKSGKIAGFGGGEL
jgi:hypothetical protein